MQRVIARMRGKPLSEPPSPLPEVPRVFVENPIYFFTNRFAVGGPNSAVSAFLPSLLLVRTRPVLACRLQSGLWSCTAVRSMPRALGRAAGQPSPMRLPAS